jgi:hypothetical protein
MKRSAQKQSPFRFLQSATFWIPFCITLVLAALFFAWELGVFINYLPSFPRPSVLFSEFIFTATISLLLAFDIALAIWQSRFGSCPRGVKRASTVATAIGALTLICPACVLLPVSFLSVGAMLSLMATHLPVLRVVSVGLLIVTAMMLWPKKS